MIGVIMYRALAKRGKENGGMVFIFEKFQIKLVKGNRDRLDL